MPQRRAQQIESNRQFDLFANLSINDDSDSDEAAEDGDTHVAASGAVGPYVALLKERTVDNDMDAESVQSPGPPDHPPGISEVLDVPSAHTSEKKRWKKRNKKKSKNNNKPSKWADQCMYAELLEMASDDPYWSANGSNEDHDPLPNDLESGWVAVAPVPVGKRCLVVTHQAAGRGGTGGFLLLNQPAPGSPQLKILYSREHDRSVTVAREILDTPVPFSSAPFDGA